MRTGFDAMPLPLVLVRCRHCHKTAGRFSAGKGETGSWSHKERNRGCHCDPPPTLPAGDELDALVARAWREMRYDGRAPVVVSS
jgi:hypothetical protein